jgi:hypothetical protein
MNAANLGSSARLRRVDAILADGKYHSTMEIVLQAKVCAVNSIVAELRANGREISCRREGNTWFYRMEQ